MEVDGVTMTSTLLPEKMAGLGRVFTFLATEGVELLEWAETLESNLDLVFAGRLREAVCKQYQALLEKKIGRKRTVALLEENGMAKNFTDYPKSALWLIGLRKKINEMIENS